MTVDTAAQEEVLVMTVDTNPQALHKTAVFADVCNGKAGHLLVSEMT